MDNLEFRFVEVTGVDANNSGLLVTLQFRAKDVSGILNLENVEARPAGSNTLVRLYEGATGAGEPIYIQENYAEVVRRIGAYV